MDTLTAVNQEPVQITPGFQDPVHEAQACFRAIMNATARPGIRQKISISELAPPAPLTPTGAAIALTLFDYDTPIWLDKTLMASEAVKAFLRFHTGAPIVSEPVEAAFALVADATHLVPIASFNQGSAEYPDRSTTVILTGQNFKAQQSVTLTGPGVKDTEHFETSPLPPVFWDQVISNAKQFPRGVDLIFAGDGEIAALPRSSRISIQEA